MRDEFLRVCLWVYLITSLILFLSMGYAYYVNARKPAGDPQKRDYHPLAFTLLPFWPLELSVVLVLFVLRALLYGVFLVLFTLALIFIRKPFLLMWLAKAAQYIGDRMLRLNTWIVRLFIPPPVPQPV
ncbi:MAG: hypothetical protein AB1509_14655 [Chloroflexota bacterium]